MGSKFETMDLNLGGDLSKKNSAVPETGKNPSIKELDPGVSLKGFGLEPAPAKETKETPSAFGAMISSAREQLSGVEQKNWEKFNLDKARKSKLSKAVGEDLKKFNPNSHKSEDESGPSKLGSKKQRVTAPSIDPKELKSKFDPTVRGKKTAEAWFGGKPRPENPLVDKLPSPPPPGTPKERVKSSKLGDHTAYDKKIPGFFKRLPRAVKVGAAIATPVVAGLAGAGYAAGKYMESKHKRDAQGRFANKGFEIEEKCSDRGSATFKLGEKLKCSNTFAKNVKTKGFEVEEKGVVSALRTAARNVDRNLVKGQSGVDHARVLGQQVRMLGRRAKSAIAANQAGAVGPKVKPRPSPTVAQRLHTMDDPGDLTGHKGGSQTKLLFNQLSKRAKHKGNYADQLHNMERLTDPGKYFAKAKEIQQQIPAPTPRRMTTGEKVGAAVVGSGLVSGGVLAADKLDVKKREQSRLAPKIKNVVSGVGRGIDKAGAKIKKVGQ